MGRITKEMILEDLSGQVFGKLTLIKKLPKISGVAIKYHCRCECGNIKDVCSTSLKNGDTKSCGCLRIETIVKRETIHGNKGRDNRSPEYVCWVGMKERCYNENNPAYYNYGGRGIKICDRWLNSFENFLLDMGHKPSRQHSLDRYPNNDGNYEPRNCRWATPKEQSRNVRNNVWLEYNGIRLLLTDWCRKLKVHNSLISYHLNKNKGFGYVVEYFVKKKGIKI